MAVLRPVGKFLAATASTAVMAEFGLPALGALVFLVALVLAVACWVIRSDVRADRVSRMLLAWRGNASCLARDNAVPMSIPPPPRRRPWSRRS